MRPTPAVRFVDTNVLLYAISTTPAESAKRQVARAILDSTDIALSVQVLQEFYVQATRPTRSGRLTHDQALGLVEAWLRFPLQDISRPLMQAAMLTAGNHRLSLWDAAIIEAARTLGCDVVLSEDLTDGQRFGSVRVENPFR